MSYKLIIPVGRASSSNVVNFVQTSTIAIFNTVIHIGLAVSFEFLSITSRALY